MKTRFLVLTCLLVSVTSLATGAQRKALPPKAVSREQPCQDPSSYRKHGTQGTALWGTVRQVEKEEMSSVLTSLDLGRIQLRGAVLKNVQVQEGRLVAPSLEPGALVGAMLAGTASDGQPVEVALCGAEQAPEDPSMEWYRIEVWNAVSGSWENPCIATHRVPAPRVLAVRGVWDGSGARHEQAGKFTFACENGAIAKCIRWGYRPWETKKGRSLEELHQACTRMARADYCGDGHSHTHEETGIDVYDSLGVLERTLEASPNWEPRRASFEAAWGPEGAWCLARTRDGQKVETLLEQCPGRFEAGVRDLGEGDRCIAHRKEESAGTVLLRNHSYTQGE